METELQVENNGSEAPLELEPVPDMPPSPDSNDALAPGEDVQTRVRQRSHGGAGVQDSLHEQTIRQLAGFGVAAPGLLGMLAYAFRVWRRLPKLTAKARSARTAREQAWEALLVQKARLGRQAFEDGVRHDALARLMEKAAALAEKQREVQQEENRLASVHDEAQSRLDTVISAVEAETEPVRKQEADILSRYDQIRTERKRSAARIRRSEIELRNLDELISQRQTAFSDLAKSREERDELLAQIADLDHQKAPIQARMKIENGSLEQVTERYQGVKKELLQIRETLSVKAELIAGYQQKKEEAGVAFEARREEIRSRSAEESLLAQEAWAQVGELVFIHRLFETQSLQMMATETETARRGFLGAQDVEEQYGEALVSYDADVFRRAKQLALLGIGAVALLVILSLIAITR